MSSTSGIPAAHIEQAKALVWDVLVHILDYGKAELGTKQSAQLQVAHLMLSGKTVPPETAQRAGL